jgi:hypothetical protein
MGFPKYVRRQGIIEYLLLIVIVILIITIVIKLFGPAINNFIQSLLENV